MANGIECITIALASSSERGCAMRVAQSNRLTAGWPRWPVCAKRPPSPSQPPAKDKRTPPQSLRRENRVLCLHIRRLPFRPPRSGFLHRRRWSSPMSSGYDRESLIAPLWPGALGRAGGGESASALDRGLRQVRPGVWTWIGPAGAEPRERETQRSTRRHPDIISPDEPDARQGGRSGPDKPHRDAP